MKAFYVLNLSGIKNGDCRHCALDLWGESLRGPLPVILQPVATWTGQGLWQASWPQGYLVPAMQRGSRLDQGTLLELKCKKPEMGSCFEDNSLQEYGMRLWFLDDPAGVFANLVLIRNAGNCPGKQGMLAVRCYLNPKMAQRGGTRDFLEQQNCFLRWSCHRW